MRYALKDLPALFQTAAGRMQLRGGINYRLWPLSSRLARLHRMTLAHKTRVIAVVGSLGKSTTARAVAAALDQRTDGWLVRNSWSSVAFGILRIRPGQRHAVIEVGIAAPGQMQAYASVVRPNVTIVTSIGSEHHRSLGTLDVTRAEKVFMVRALLATGTALLNGDDPNVLWMKQHSPARVVTFGFGDACDVRATDVRLDWPHGTRCRVDLFGKRVELTLRLVGRTMIYPALAAVATAHLEGIPLDEAAGRLASLAPTPGRMEPVALAGDVMLLCDDFKSTLESIHAALDVFADIPARRRLVVLGDVSEPPVHQRQTYRAIGERVARMADGFIVVGHGLDAYHAGARSGGMPSDSIVDGGRTPRQAADALAALLRPGDVVLIKGRDTQMLDRIRLILQGRNVRCDIRYCSLHTTCADCPMLEPGWGTHRVIM